jgi:hypothetical protein
MPKPAEKVPSRYARIKKTAGDKRERGKGQGERAMGKR